ncbi:G patch domain-containing protein 4 [Tachysurus fulvidraco]|uniref:G patch domain-containing protein 4 n=1 Tax=Tachysurus fulvidraco TaxID=1234273 RepID=UPI001FF03C08|nr:G patch domain-containing protein 4 [Tachysurus fulvidraco]
MTETAKKKSFAEQQLLRHGWEQGKGLGRAENGISEAIKVKVKCDKGGVGHKESEQFTFHWWDHVFNKASANLSVESDQNGVVLKKTEEEEDGMVSNKKPRKALMNKSMLYGCFVKSATLLSGQEQPEVKSSGSEDSSSEDEEKLDLSSTKNLSDAQLMKACGGRTAHKGARHGLKMSAKLARLEQQEQEFIAKYGKKKQMDKSTSLSDAALIEHSSSLDQERAEKTEQKKAKKKKQCSDDTKENGAQDNSESSQEHKMSKKQKKRSKDKVDLESKDAADSFVDPKRKTKKTKLEQEEESTEMQEEVTEHQPTEESVFKKKKKKKKKHTEKSTAPVSEESVEKPESRELQPEPDACKKRKKKPSKANKDKPPATEIDSCCSLDITTAEKVLSLQSQPKKRKQREEELEAETENSDIKKTSEKKKKKHTV